MSGGNNQGEPAIILLMAIVLFSVLGWVLWHVSRDFWIANVFRWVRFSELWIVNLFARHYDSCLDWLRYAQLNDNNPSPRVIGLTNVCFGSSYLSQLPPGELSSYYSLSLPPILALGALTMSYYRWPLSAFFIVVGIYELFYTPRNKFMVKHTLETMISTQAKMWPTLLPIVKFNPSKSGRILGDPVPDKLPPFAEALSPEEWVTWNHIPVVNGIPDRDASRRGFVRQLGPRWNGMSSLPTHIRALLAAFALRGAQKRDESEALLGHIAESWSPEKGLRLDGKITAEIDKILRDPELGGKLIPVTDQHAWRTTAILGALRWARANGGVLPPAQFLWLRAEDRALWYPLNNLGRRSFHSEGAGAMAHFMAEDSAKKPLPIPRVETAVVTLNAYLHDPEKRPIPIPPSATAKS